MKNNLQVMDMASHVDQSAWHKDCKGFGTDMIRLAMGVFLVLAVWFQVEATPTIGRLVSGFSWGYPYVRINSPTQYTKVTYGTPEFDDICYVEVTNVTDIASVKPVLTYGWATDEDVVLNEPTIYVSTQLKEMLRQELLPNWEKNIDWYDWDYESQEVVLVGPVQEVFDNVGEYFDYHLSGLSTDEDYWPDIENAPVSNRCWVAFVLKASGRKTPAELTFSVGIEGSPVKPYVLGVRGTSYDENTSEWERNEWGGQIFGVYSTNYIKRALGVDVLWITNAYQIPLITRPYAGGQDMGKAYVTFGGSNSLDICFNAPMAGTYYIDGDFPYDYSYCSPNSTLNWTTDTPGAVVHNMRPAIPSGATGSSAFTHLYQIQFCVDKAGPCVLKSPIANNVVYASIPYKPGQPRVSYPGHLSTDSDGNSYGSTFVSIYFVPAETNSVFVSASALQYDSDMNLQSCGTVTPPKVWLQGEEVVVEASPYDGYEFDHWEWSSALDVPAGIDLTSRIVRFVVEEGFFDNTYTYRNNALYSKIALKARWKRPSRPVLPSFFINSLLLSGKSDSSCTAETILSALACNGRNTVEECYIAGMDPESDTSELTAAIELVDGVPKITWEPALNGPGEKNGVRKYTIYGSNDLHSWVKLDDGTEINFCFFKVTVEMN